MSIQKLFPTPIFETSNIVSEELNHILKNYILSFPHKEANNRIFTTTELPQLTDLSLIIKELSLDFINQNYFSCSQVHIDSNMACHFKLPGIHKSFPQHRDVLGPIASLFQAVYYIAGNQGNLRFYDPRWLDVEWRNKIDKKAIYYEVAVEPRKLVIFPTFLWHDVSESNSTLPRVSLDTSIEIKWN